MAAQSHQRTKVFISYSHQDADWLQRLRVHLKPLEREHRIDIWDDTRIKAGSSWREEIGQALAATKVAILLVSADFLASDFITADELPPLLSAAEKEGAIILPVIISPSRFERTSSLAQFQAVNNPSKPLIGLARNEQEAALVKVCEAIEVSLNRPPELLPGHGPESERTRIHESRIPKRADTYKPLRTEVRTPSESRRTKFPKLHPAVWAAIITGIVALITAYWQFVYKPTQPSRTIQYAGRVTDQTSQRAVRGAKVSAEVQGIPQVYYTDSDGVFNLQIRDSADTIRILVEAEGYESFDRNVSLSRSVVEDVRLAPLNISPQPAPTVNPGISVGKNENKSIPDGKSTSRVRPKGDSTLDLEERKRRARQDLNYPSPTPEP